MQGKEKKQAQSKSTLVQMPQGFCAAAESAKLGEILMDVA
jgi:hypothetical protein